MAKQSTADHAKPRGQKKKKHAKHKSKGSKVGPLAAGQKSTRKSPKQKHRRQAVSAGKGSC